MKGLFMKHKLIALGLLCIVFTSCAPEREPPVPEITTVTTEVTTTHSTDEPLPPVVGPNIPGGLQSGIGVKDSRFNYTEGEDVILCVSLSLPVASVVGDDALQQSLSAQLSVVEKELQTRIDLLYQQYLKDYQAGIDGLTTPSVQVRYDLHYFTTEAVSMTYIFTQTTRDGMVFTNRYHSNLDLRVGSKIRLSALLAEETTDGVLALTVQKLKAAPPAGLYANAEQILASRIDSSWFIAGGQLTVILEAGVIAPLSSGDVVVTFAEKDLQGLLSDYGKALL
jgi:hypothetical protein